MAPLCSRRGIAMLVLLYKMSHGLCHPHLREVFPTAAALRSSRGLPRLASGSLARGGHNSRQLLYRGDVFQGRYFKSSLFGLVQIWNLLPEAFVNAVSVSNFQSSLIRILKVAAKSEVRDWHLLYSLPSVHPLLVQLCHGNVR